MQKQIWKFNLIVGSEFKVPMPINAEIISVKSQNNSGVMWAICDTQADKEVRTFRIYGTGHNMPSNGLKHIGTFQESDGMLVWHLFEIVKIKYT